MPTVLIVEDEHVLRLTFEQFLLEEHYQVFTAAHYAEAIDLLAKHSIDVVVSDIILGGETGISLLRHISAQEQDCQVIMITGDPSVETASEAVRLGAFDYLPKPVTEHALKRVVHRAMEQKRLLEERDQYAAAMERYRLELEAIFNGVNAGILMLDSTLNIRQANHLACDYLSLDLPNALGTPIAPAFPPGFETAQQALIECVESGHAIQGQRVEYKDPQGALKVLDIAVTLIESENDTLNGTLMIFRDVTRLMWLEDHVQSDQGYLDVVGKSARMKEIFELIHDLSETDATVLICGESGTGKEVVATALHHSSPRTGKNFVKVNCAALSDDLLESELFGHVKGAFTGAVQDRIGRFELADGGTILLDEIGDISPMLQLRLLRVLQTGEFERVGDSKSLKVNVRIIAATNQNLLQKIQLGEFRQDLYYRLNVVRIEMPALRDRKEDIPLLVDKFCLRFNTTMNKEILGLANDALETMMSYPWPGNVRELENCIERSFIVCHEPYIEERHLPHEVRNPDSMPTTMPLPAHRTPGIHYREIVVNKESILKVLHETDWNVAKSARMLGMARNTLYQKMKSMEIQRPLS